MKYILAFGLAFAQLQTFASQISTIRDTTLITCADLNQFLNSERQLRILACSDDQTNVVSAAAKHLITDKICPPALERPLPPTEHYHVKFEEFYVQTKDNLKCQVGFRYWCQTKYRYKPF